VIKTNEVYYIQEHICLKPEENNKIHNLFSKTTCWKLSDYAPETHCKYLSLPGAGRTLCLNDKA